VYILRCNDGSLYVGRTNDLDARLGAHNNGTAALFTRKLSAVQRERQIKRWTRAKKEALIAGDRLRLRRL
jgi:predicted GIY-YIG superfamily endonuclease